MDDFDPDTVPTVGELLNELDRIQAGQGDEGETRRVEGRLSSSALVVARLIERYQITSTPRSNRMLACSKSMWRRSCGTRGALGGVSVTREGRDRAEADLP